jgi:DNA modification methylase
VSGRLYRGDCLEILPKLPEASVQRALTSPPYNIDQGYGAEGAGDHLPLPRYAGRIPATLAWGAAAPRVVTSERPGRAPARASWRTDRR